MTLRAAAGEIGISHGSLWNYEQGRTVPHAYADRAAIQRWTKGRVKVASWDADEAA